MSYRIHLDKNFENFGENKEISIKDKYKFFEQFYECPHSHDKKILGIHFRGTSYKIKEDIFYQLLKARCKNILKFKKESHDKIFLCTQRTRYLSLKKKYPDKLLYLNTYISTKMMLS